MPVVLAAPAPYMRVPAPWQRVEAVPAVNTGVPTESVTDMVLITCAEGPLHPFAVTCILTDPENPLAQVITPKEFILPAAPLLKDQFNPVLFVAVVAYVVVVVPLVN